jgi:metal-responsive CopG/Arc/MetJ family transcriptional regulator
MQTKSVKSVSLPDTLWNDLDRRSEKWGGNRSAALARIYLEWLEHQAAAPAPVHTRKAESTLIAA